MATLANFEGTVTFLFGDTPAMKSGYIPALCDTLMALHSSDAMALQRLLQLLYVDDTHCQDFRYQSMLHLFDEHADHGTGSELTRCTCCCCC